MKKKKLSEKDLKGLLCGFRLFVGDCVEVTSSTVTSNDVVGVVQWIDPVNKWISVRFDRKGGPSYCVVRPNEVKRANGRGQSTLIVPQLIKKVYNTMSFQEKCFFHYNRGRSPKEIADMASVPIDRVKGALKVRKEDIIYEAK